MVWAAMVGASTARNRAARGNRWRGRCLGMTTEVDPQKRPSVTWFKTRKGRGYGKYDFGSHGVPHASQ